MTAELLKSIPTILRGIGADLKAMPSSEESWYASTGGEVDLLDHASDSARYYGALTTSSTDAVAIGSYTDTFYNESIGTHPGSSLSVGSTTTTLYQYSDSSDVFANNFGVVALDSSGDIFEMDSSSVLLLGERLLESNLLNERRGNFRISSSSPSADWELYESSIFTDTKTNGNTDYNLYRKSADPSVSSTLDFYPMQLVDSDASTADIQEVSLEKAKRIGSQAIVHARQLTGLGDYLLLPSSQTPTGNGETGTWVSRGTAVDTRNTTENLQYTTAQYTSAFFSSQYTRQYTGQYTGISYADIPGTFAGQRAAQFSGSRSFSGQYVGQRTFSGQYGGSRTYSGNYAGERSFTSSPVDFAGTRPAAVQFAGERTFSGQYAGVRQNDTQFAGTRTTPAQFVGVRGFVGQRTVTSTYAGTRTAYYPGNFSGSRVTPDTPSVSANFTGPGPTEGFGVNGQWAGVRQVSFVGQRNAQFTGTKQFTGVRGFDQPSEPQPFIAQFSGPHQFAGQRPGSFSGPSPAQFGGIHRFVGTRQFAGVRSFAGTRTVTQSFAGVRSAPIGQQFSVTTVTGPTNFTSPGTFAGTTTTPANFSSQVDYAGQYGGSRTYSTQYAGVRSFAGQYVGTRNFVGERNSAGNRTYAAQYVGTRQNDQTFGGFRTTTSNFAGNVAQDFGGTRPATYTNQYSGQYASQYTGQFTSQYSNQFTGETLVAVSQVVETFTLYCRISES
jgi:hypothetical protein